MCVKIAVFTDFSLSDHCPPLNKRLKSYRNDEKIYLHGDNFR